MSQLKQAGLVRLRLLKVFNSKQPGHVEDYPYEIAKGLVDGKMAEEAAGADLTPHIRKVWEQGKEVSESIEAKDTRIAELEAQLAEKPKRGRPAKQEMSEDIAA